MVISGYSEFFARASRFPIHRSAVPLRKSRMRPVRATSLNPASCWAFSRKQMARAQGSRTSMKWWTENLKMLTRMIGEDIDLVMVPTPTIGAVRCRSRADRPGHHESGLSIARDAIAGKAAS